MWCYAHLFVFFFNDTATTEIYTLSLHDALPISQTSGTAGCSPVAPSATARCVPRSEEHTSELQSHSDLVCRLLLEKKKNNVILLTIVKEGKHLHERKLHNNSDTFLN